LRFIAGPVVVVLFVAVGSGSIGWGVTIAILSGLGLAGYVLAPWIAEQQAVTTRRRDALRDRADLQHRWAQHGDSRGVYGTEGAELMRRICIEPNLDDADDNTAGPTEVAAVAYTADGLDTLLTERPACWRYAAFIRMFGDPADERSADAETIVHAANRLMDLHERLLRLAEDCRSVDAPSQHAEVVRDCAHVLDVPLEGYRRFIDEFVVRIDELREVLPYARVTVEMDPVMLTMADSDEVLDKAFKGIRGLAPGS